MSVDDISVHNATDSGPDDAPVAVRRRGLRRWDPEPYALPITWVIAIVVFALLRPDTFATRANVTSILSSQAVLLVLALALLVPLTVGDLDVSVGSVVGFSAMITALLNVNHHMNPVISAIIAVAASCVVGLFNGLVATKLKVDLLVVTLGTGSLVAGLTAWMSGQNTVTGVSSGLVSSVVSHHIFGVSPEFYYGIGIAIVMFYLLRYTPVGRRMLIVGQAREVATLSGINVPRIRVTGLIICSGLAGVAGILYVGTSGGAAPTGGTELLLPAYAAAFLGATTIMPGRFNAFGTIIAVYFLVTGITGLQLLGAQTYVQQLFYGGALIVAVSVSILVRSRRSQKV